MHRRTVRSGDTDSYSSGDGLLAVPMFWHTMVVVCTRRRREMQELRLIPTAVDVYLCLMVVNDATGYIPEMLARLAALQTLDLSDNGLVGETTREDESWK